MWSGIGARVRRRRRRYLVCGSRVFNAYKRTRVNRRRTDEFLGCVCTCIYIKCAVVYYSAVEGGVAYENMDGATLRQLTAYRRRSKGRKNEFIRVCGLTKILCT